MSNLDLERIRRCEKFTALDLQFARFLAGLAGNGGPELFLSAALASSYTRQGHICIDLGRLAGKPLLEGGEGRASQPPLGEWLDKLRASRVVGRPGQYRPLILDKAGRLYLYRYWDYQERLARAIRSRSTKACEVVEHSWLQGALARLFPGARGQKVDWQKVAGCTAVLKRFCVVSGGPGTGKTTTVAKILALLLEQASPRKLRIALAAPTGKAAARLQEAIGQLRLSLESAPEIRSAIPETASTIHRLLGTIPGSPYFRHCRENPLPADVVVVDEASMVDLALMSKLAQALEPESRLILLGDKDQLASVETGAVLGDICDTGKVHGFSAAFAGLLSRLSGCVLEAAGEEESPGALRDCIVQLRESYRFGENSGIAQVSREINRGDGRLALKLLKEGRGGDIGWRDLPRAAALPQALAKEIVAGFSGYLASNDPWKMFERLEGFRILCALRQGPYGSVALNLLVEQVLRREKLIASTSGWYHGRPVMITRNDYNLQLFNGDVGIVLAEPEAANDLRVFFPEPEGGFRKFHPLRLPEHETVYAMTVHKSQGSEFDRVLLLLPERDSPVLSRELLYTGITRARQKVEIWGVDSVFQAAVGRRLERMSGLRDLLWQDQAPGR